MTAEQPPCPGCNRVPDGPGETGRWFWEVYHCRHVQEDSYSRPCPGPVQHAPPLSEEAFPAELADAERTAELARLAAADAEQVRPLSDEDLADYDRKYSGGDYDPHTARWRETVRALQVRAKNAEVKQWGAEERVKLALSHKNYWVKRAEKAEQLQNAAVTEALNKVSYAGRMRAERDDAVIQKEKAEREREDTRIQLHQARERLDETEGAAQDFYNELEKRIGLEAQLTALREAAMPFADEANETPSNQQREALAESLSQPNPADPGRKG